MTDEVEVEMAEPVPPTKNGGKTHTTKDDVYAARDMIPVGPSGARPETFAQQVDFAKTMAMAKIALPEHLRGSPGDCLAIIDMASRANLSPYMVALKTYVQQGRLCFELQLFHAFAQGSGLMRGELNVEYEGEGDERVCIITGFVKGDALPKVHRSPPLKDLHPGTVTKDGKEFVRGSQLWNCKPDVQLFYDTSRDWVRMYCPRAVLGIYSPEELEEYGPDYARDVTPLSERLALPDRPQTGEGFRRGEHLAEELARISPNQGPAPEPEPEPEDAPEPEEAPPKAHSAPLRGLDRLKRFRGRERPETHQRAGKSRRGRMPSKEEVRRAADRAERGRGVPPKGSAPGAIGLWPAGAGVDREGHRCWPGAGALGFRAAPARRVQGQYKRTQMARGQAGRCLPESGGNINIMKLH